MAVATTAGFHYRFKHDYAVAVTAGFHYAGNYFFNISRIQLIKVGGGGGGGGNCISAILSVTSAVSLSSNAPFRRARELLESGPVFLGTGASVPAQQSPIFAPTPPHR